MTQAARIVFALVTLTATAATVAYAGSDGLRPQSATASQPTGPHSGPRRPTIVEKFIPFGQRRKGEMAAYSKRHYGQSTYKLTNPKVIVEHSTVNNITAASAPYNTFAPDVADPELHELPGVCSHFVIGPDGTIVQLVSLSIRCRHTVGLNRTSFGIEHVGFSGGDP